jgi:ElaB/YqjD/DUF883 family membrane-anchored ribosome-binding protein
MTDQTKRKIEEIIQEERDDADRKYPLFSSLHEGESVIREEIEEVSEVLDEIMETHNWIWKAVRANKSETVKSAAKTIAKLSRELIAESVQVAAVAGKIVDSINGSEKRGSHCEKCATDYDECPCNTCARDNYSKTRARTTDCCEKHKREKSEEGELIHCREWTKCADYTKENTDESI